MNESVELPLSVGLVDFRSLETKDVDPTHQYGLAVAQMITLDGVRAKLTSAAKLLLRPCTLVNRKFIDGYRLEFDERSEFHGFQEQSSVRGHTATLIGSDRVLTAAHAVVPRDLRSTYAVFGRLGHHTTAKNQEGWLEIPPLAAGASIGWVRVNNLLAWENARINKEELAGDINPDWALLELAAPVPPEFCAPIPVASAGLDAYSEFEMFSYPLGLPLKRAEARRQRGSAKTGMANMLADFGSGSSGAPLLGKIGERIEVLGVVSGAARFDANDRTVVDVSCECIRPQQRNASDEDEGEDSLPSQPLTLATHIRTKLRF